jgi:hypothetical protein
MPLFTCFDITDILLFVTLTPIDDAEYQRPDYLIAEGGKVVSRAYMPGNTTKGSL